jgi:hypothetical protein
VAWAGDVLRSAGVPGPTLSLVVTRELAACLQECREGVQDVASAMGAAAAAAAQPKPPAALTAVAGGGDAAADRASVVAEARRSFGGRVLDLARAAFANDSMLALSDAPGPADRGVPAIEAALSELAGAGAASAGDRRPPHAAWRDPAKARKLLHRLLVAHADTLAGVAGHRRRWRELESKAKQSVLGLLDRVEKAVVASARTAEQARQAYASATAARKAVDEPEFEAREPALTTHRAPPRERSRICEATISETQHAVAPS